MTAGFGYRRILAITIAFALLLTGVPLTPNGTASAQDDSDGGRPHPRGPSLIISNHEPTAFINTPVVLNAMFQGVGEEEHEQEEILSLQVHWDSPGTDASEVAVQANSYEATVEAKIAGTYLFRIYATTADSPEVLYEHTTEMTFYDPTPIVSIERTYSNVTHNEYRVMQHERFELRATVTDYLGNPLDDADIVWTTGLAEGEGKLADIRHGEGTPAPEATGDSVMLQANAVGTGWIQASVTVEGETYSDRVPLTVLEEVPWYIEIGPEVSVNGRVGFGREFIIAAITDLTSGGNLPDRVPIFVFNQPSAFQITAQSERRITVKGVRNGSWLLTVRVQTTATIQDVPVRFYEYAIPLAVYEPIAYIPDLEGLVKGMKAYSAATEALRPVYQTLLKKAFDDAAITRNPESVDRLSHQPAWRIYGYIDDKPMSLSSGTFIGSLKPYIEVLSLLSRTRELQAEYADIHARARPFISALVAQGHFQTTDLFMYSWLYNERLAGQLTETGQLMAKPYGNATGPEQVYAYLFKDVQAYTNNTYTLVQAALSDATHPATAMDVQKALGDDLHAYSRALGELGNVAQYGGFFSGELHRKHYETATMMNQLLTERNDIRNYLTSYRAVLEKVTYRRLTEPIQYALAVDDGGSYAYDYPKVSELRALMRSKKDVIYNRSFEMSLKGYTYMDRFRVPLLLIARMKAFMEAHQQFREFQEPWVSKVRSRVLMGPALAKQKAHYDSIYWNSMQRFRTQVIPYLGYTKYEVPFYSLMPTSGEEWGSWAAEITLGFQLPFTNNHIKGIVTSAAGARDDNTRLEYIELPRLAGIYEHYRDIRLEDMTIKDMQAMAEHLYKRGEEFSRLYHNLKSRVEAENIGWLIAGIFVDAVKGVKNILTGNVADLVEDVVGGSFDIAETAQEVAYQEEQNRSNPARWEIRRVE